MPLNEIKICIALFKWNVVQRSANVVTVVMDFYSRVKFNSYHKILHQHKPSVVIIGVDLNKFNEARTQTLGEKF